MNNKRRWFLYSKKESKFVCKPDDFTFAYTYTNDIQKATYFELNEVYDYFKDELFAEHGLVAIEIHLLLHQASPYDR